MTDADLTTATEFELVEATHHKQVGGDRDATDDIEIDRWQNYGKDRLYLNGLKTGDGWVSLKNGESGGDRWTKVSADYELDGDTLTITVGNRSPTYTLVVRVHGDGFEATEDEIGDDETHECEECGDEFDGEHGKNVHKGLVHNDGEGSDDTEAEATNDQRAVADGGRDLTDHVDDEMIEDAIEGHDGTLDHPKTATVEEVRDALAWLQQSVTEFWSEWMSNVENGESEVIHEDSDIIVFSTGKDSVVRRDLREHYDGDASDRLRDAANAIHHELARERCDYDWSYEYPLVVRKPEGFDAGQEFVDAVINSLLRRDLSPGQAWAYYGVKIRCESRNAWAKRCGYSDHSAVSEALRKAEAKLP